MTLRAVLVKETNIKLLNTAELSVQIESLFKAESEYLVVMSPYLKITKKLLYLLSSATAKITFIFRECDSINEIRKIAHNAVFLNIHELHAKAYINDTIAIVASLNLYEYSQINNFELGVLFTKNENMQEYVKLLDEINILCKANGFERIGNDIDDDKDIDEIPLKYEDRLTMGNLYKALRLKYGFKRRLESEIDREYLQICVVMREKYKFERSQLYEDGSLVLRSTLISKEMFDFGISNIEFK